MPPNQNPEQAARDRIDRMLGECGWVVQDNKAINFNAGPGIAVRGYQTDLGLRACQETAVTEVYRLLKHAKAKRILFLVDGCCLFSRTLDFHASAMVRSAVPCSYLS